MGFSLQLIECARLGRWRLPSVACWRSAPRTFASATSSKPRPDWPTPKRFACSRPRTLFAKKLSSPSHERESKRGVAIVGGGTGACHRPSNDSKRSARDVGGARSARHRRPPSQTLEGAKPMTDTRNVHLVAIDASQPGCIVLAMPPRTSLTREQALMFAAWLVTTADAADDPPRAFNPHDFKMCVEQIKESLARDPMSQAAYRDASDD